jgi:hypothetical protein
MWQCSTHPLFFSCFLIVKMCCDWCLHNTSLVNAWARDIVAVRTNLSQNIRNGGGHQNEMVNQLKKIDILY